MLRNPAEALPSMASMFSIMYPLHSPGLPLNHPAYRYWIELGSRFYDSFLELEQSYPGKQIIGFRYDDLLKSPEETVLKIYEHFGWIVTEKLASALREESRKSKSYRSSHHYSLRSYGYTDQDIYRRNKAIIERFGF